MKKRMFAAIALLAAMTAQAQQTGIMETPEELREELNIDQKELSYNPETGIWPKIETWQPDFEAWKNPRNEPELVPVRPSVTMSSIVNVYNKPMPRRVVVLDNNTLRVLRHIDISNGQASNWGDFPNSFLDARTLSFPVPR